MLFAEVFSRRLDFRQDGSLPIYRVEATLRRPHRFDEGLNITLLIRARGEKHARHRVQRYFPNLRVQKITK